MCVSAIARLTARGVLLGLGTMTVVMGPAVLPRFLWPTIHAVVGISL